MAADVKKNDDFSKGPISKTILRLAVPMVLAQFVNVLYNIVDRMYIGHISDTSVDALTGVGVTFLTDGDGVCEFIRLGRHAVVFYGARCGTAGRRRGGKAA